MNLPSRESLPLKALPQKLSVSSDNLKKFHKAFQLGDPTSNWIPPTFAALALQGVFSILNSLKVDWHGLLHATQSFEFHHPLRPHDAIVVETELTDLRLRAGMHWFNFKMELINEKSGQKILTSKSLIMVKDRTGQSV